MRLSLWNWLVIDFWTYGSVNVLFSRDCAAMWELYWTTFSCLLIWFKIKFSVLMGFCLGFWSNSSACYHCWPFSLLDCFFFFFATCIYGITAKQVCVGFRFTEFEVWCWWKFSDLKAMIPRMNDHKVNPGWLVIFTLRNKLLDRTEQWTPWWICLVCFWHWFHSKILALVF